MYKVSVLSKVVTFAILAALVLALLPSTGVLAGGTPDVQEKRWEELNNMYKTQKLLHTKIDRMHANWHEHEKTARYGDVNLAKFDQNLVKVDSALATAQAVINTHSGFDDEGKVIDVALADKSIKLLHANIIQHSHALRQLKLLDVHTN